MSTGNSITSLSFYEKIASFYDDPGVKTLGYFPIMSIPIGVVRVALNVHRLITELSSATLRNYYIVEIVRGVCETSCLGVIMAIYDLFFKKNFTAAPSAVSPLMPQPIVSPLVPPHTVSPLILPSEPPIIVPQRPLGFVPVHSNRFIDHVPQLVAHYQTRPPGDDLRRQFANYTSEGTHALNGQHIFAEADFYPRHGIMHACFVAQFIPILIQFYREFGHQEALAMTEQDITAMQIVGFFHDYGRIVTQNDLGRDTPDSEAASGQTAKDYLLNMMGLTQEQAEHFARSITTSSALMTANKPFLSQILQSTDCLGVLRADDWLFNHQFLNAFRWINFHIVGEEQKIEAREKIFEIVDIAKLYLVELGDSPYDIIRLSGPRRGEIIQGRFSLETKRAYETNPQCYDLMSQRLTHIAENYIQ